MKYNVEFLEEFRGNKSNVNNFPPEGNYTYIINNAYFKNNQTSSSGSLADILYLDLLIKDISNNSYTIQTKYYYFLDENIYSSRLNQFWDDLEMAYKNNNKLYSKIFPNENNFEETALIGTSGALTVIHKPFNGKVYANVSKLIPNGSVSKL